MTVKKITIEEVKLLKPYKIKERLSERWYCKRCSSSSGCPRGGCDIELVGYSINLIKYYELPKDIKHMQ